MRCQANSHNNFGFFSLHRVWFKPFNLFSPATSFLAWVFLIYWIVPCTVVIITIVVIDWLFDILSFFVQATSCALLFSPTISVVQALWCRFDLFRCILVRKFYFSVMSRLFWKPDVKIVWIFRSLFSEISIFTGASKNFFAVVYWQGKYFLKYFSNSLM